MLHTGVLLAFAAVNRSTADVDDVKQGAIRRENLMPWQNSRYEHHEVASGLIEGIVGRLHLWSGSLSHQVNSSI